MGASVIPGENLMALRACLAMESWEKLIIWASLQCGVDFDSREPVKPSVSSRRYTGFARDGRLRLRILGSILRRDMHFINPLQTREDLVPSSRG